MPKKRLLRITTVVMCLLVASLLNVSAIEIDVPGDFGTIQDAVSSANPGDTIIIAEGIYEESFAVNKNNLTIKSSKGPQFTTIKGTVTIESAYGILLEGLTVTGSGGGVRVRGNCLGVEPTLTIRDSFLSANVGTSIDFSGSIYNGVVIENSEINRNGADGINLSGSGEDITITGCEIYSNGMIEATGVGIRIGRDVSDVTIEGNVISANVFANIHPM